MEVEIYAAALHAFWRPSVPSFVRPLAHSHVKDHRWNGVDARHGCQMAKI